MGAGLDWSDFLFGFEGRIGRAEYWLYTAIVVAISLAVLFLASEIGHTTLVYYSYYFLLAYPSAAIAAKRLHDRNKSGQWAWLFIGMPFATSALDIIPFQNSGLASIRLLVSTVSLVVSIWAIVELGFLRGTVGENAFGPDPVAQTENSFGGYSVKVLRSTPDGRSSQDIFYVAEANPEVARGIVRDANNFADESVKAVAPLMQQTLDGLGLKPGEFAPAPHVK